MSKTVTFFKQKTTKNMMTQPNSLDPQIAKTKSLWYLGITLSLLASSAGMIAYGGASTALSNQESSSRALLIVGLSLIPIFIALLPAKLAIEYRRKSFQITPQI